MAKETLQVNYGKVLTLRALSARGIDVRLLSSDTVKGEIQEGIVRRQIRGRADVRRVLQLSWKLENDAKRVKQWQSVYRLRMMPAAWKWIAVSGVGMLSALGYMLESTMGLGFGKLPLYDPEAAKTAAKAETSEP